MRQILRSCRLPTLTALHADLPGNKKSRNADPGVRVQVDMYEQVALVLLLVRQI